MARKADKGVAMDMMSSTIYKVSVLRSKETGRVLYLEAGKGFVDTLLSFLLLPIGTVIYMLEKTGGQVKALGGISSVYKSVVKFDCSFLRVDKLSLLQPRSAVASTSESTGLVLALEAANLRIQLPAVDSLRTKLSVVDYLRTKEYMQSYKTIGTSNTYYDDTDYQSPPNSEGAGFVKENITYMITDNLELMPSTTFKIIKLFNELKVATFADLECTDIDVTVTQIFQLLQAALTSSSCLNEVFGKK